MKKVLFSMVAIGFIATTMTSCQSNQKGTQESNGDTTKVAAVSTDTSKTAVTAPSTSGSEILKVSPDEVIKAPQFSNEEVNTGFAQFEPIKKEYVDGINANDAVKIKAATEKFNAWVKIAATWGSKLTKDENQIYIDHYSKLVTQWDKLSQKVKK